MQRDMINFMVTPNHDMVTTFGKVEAGALYETSHSRGPWKIPLTNNNKIKSVNPDAELAGYILADGWYSDGKFKISVSRPYKIEALKNLSPLNTYVQHSKGAISNCETRKIKTNFDKQIFVFDLSRVSKFIDKDKKVLCLDQIPNEDAKTLMDAWQYFDGHTNKKTGVKRIYTSRQDHTKAIEVLAVKGGYSISVWKSRQSDLS